MQQLSIKINNTDYKLKSFSFEAIKLFEDLAGKSISQCVTTWDELTYFYCMLKACNPGFETTFTEFVEICDNDPNLLIQFTTIKAENAPEQAEQPAASTVKKNWTTKQIFVLWTLFLLLAVSPVLVPVISGIAWIYASFWLFTSIIKQIGTKPN